MMNLSHSIKKNFSCGDDKALDIHDKLFLGNNIPAYMSTEKLYIPDWNTEEIELLTQILADGIKLIKDNLHTEY